MRSVNPQTGIKGMDIVLSNLHREIKKIKGRTNKGMIEAGMLIKNSMFKETPTIPFDTGNLRASFFMVTPITSRGLDASFSDKKGKASEMESDHTSAIGEAKAKADVIKDPVLIIGFSANYALWVHEMTGDINWNTPKGGAQPGAKFLQKALKRNKKKILVVIRENAYIKK